ncbi:MAG: glucose-6-phosphate dehydrogenase [Acidimicrobiales bacterium]
MPTSSPSPPTLVILGGSGDLTRRLLFPAIHRLVADGLLPIDTRIVGFAIDELTTEQFLDRLRRGVEEHGGGLDQSAWAALSANATYLQGDLTPDALKALAPHTVGPSVFYLALPPTLFGTAAAALADAGLAAEHDGSWRRLVIEKPFGTSLDTAGALQAQLLAGWREEQIFRIDHFLGKDTVQNLLVFRLANRFVEAIWNNASIAQVQITAAESLGLEGRWRYYDQAGALRDMLQNHLMQLFAVTAMEPPSVWEGETLRQHKVDVLRATRGPTAGNAGTWAVRGRYTAGTVQRPGEPEPVTVPGYREEPNIPPDTRTETYAALRLEVDNWRWQGVPFYLRSGKRLGGDLTEIALQLRPAPRLHFQRTASIDPGIENGGTQWVVLRLRPDETIEVHAVAKRAGLGMALERITLTATDHAADAADYSAYEQLLVDLVAGDRGLFVRGDEALEAWRICQPVLDAWATGEPTPYGAGSVGPEPPPGFFEPGLAGWRPVAAPASALNGQRDGTTTAMSSPPPVAAPAAEAMVVGQQGDPGPAVR